MKPMIYFNGQFTENPTLNIADRGFRFGDGVFETITVHEGVPYQLELHLERLAVGLAAIRLSIPTPHTLPDAIRKLIAGNHVMSGFVRIAISRGVGSHGYLPADGNVPTIVMEAFTRHPLTMESAKLHLSAYAKIPLACLPVNHKLAQGLSSTLARLEAKEHGCNEALMLTVDGHVAEASSANIFWVKDRTLYTPSLATGALAGTTRAAVTRLTKVTEGEYPLSALEAADEVFLTNTNWGVLPVASLGLKTWEHGEVTKEIQSLYRHDIAGYVASHRPMA